MEILGVYIGSSVVLHIFHHTYTPMAQLGSVLVMETREDCKDWISECNVLYFAM